MKRAGKSHNDRFQDHRMPESFRAFCKMVSLTAAKTSRMLVVSVAWVRLKGRISSRHSGDPVTKNLLRVEIQMCPIHLIESPQEILGSTINVVATRIIREVVAQWRSGQLLFEKVDLVEEEDDARPHKPPRVDHRVKENQALHHSVLERCQSHCVSWIRTSRLPDCSPRATLDRIHSERHRR